VGAAATGGGNCGKSVPSATCPRLHAVIAVSPLLQDRGSSGGREEKGEAGGGGGGPDAVAAVASATASAESALELARKEHTPWTADSGVLRPPAHRGWCSWYNHLGGGLPVLGA
jgi:hypothetical protein